MSYIEDLTAITTPALTDLLYIYQNGDDFKVTNQQLLDLIKTNTVIPLTQTQYDNLTPAEKNNGSIYIITDASITAADVEYTSGVSVGDKLDDLSTGLFKVVTYQKTSITLGAGGAINITGNDVGYTAFPTGYVPLALYGWYADANGVFARSVDINAISTASFCVLRSVESVSLTFTYQVKILFVKSAYAPI